MMRTALLLSLTMAIATSAPARPLLGTVDLARPVRAAGTEPFWSLDLAAGKIVFTDYSAATPQPVAWRPARPVVRGRIATWTTRTAAGVPVRITLTAARCLEVGEPEDTDPLTATVVVGSRTLNGCANLKSVLDKRS